MENVDLKPFLKGNNAVIAVLKVLAFPLNWLGGVFENMSRKHTQKMVDRWLSEIK